MYMAEDTRHRAFRRHPRLGSTIRQVGLLLELSRMSVDFFRKTLDSKLLAVEIHFLAILC